MRGRLCVLSRLRLIAPGGMGSVCPDILVCGICRMYFNDICDLAKHKVECHGGQGQYNIELVAEQNKTSKSECLQQRFN